jgi:hypothetical protein
MAVRAEPNPFGGRRATGMSPAGKGTRPAPAGGSPPMAPHTAGQYQPGHGQHSNGDLGPLLRGTAGRPDLEPRDDDAKEQPAAK